jgi:hypothetical protein
MNRNHVDKYDKLQRWIAEKEAYLQFKEEIDSVAGKLDVVNDSLL